MKQRIISALFGLVILFAVFSLFETIVLNAVVAAIIVLALHELFTAAGERHTSISYLAMGFGATIPFFKTWMLERVLPAVCCSGALVDPAGLGPFASLRFLSPAWLLSRIFVQ